MEYVLCVQYSHLPFYQHVLLYMKRDALFLEDEIGTNFSAVAQMHLSGQNTLIIHFKFSLKMRRIY